MAAGLTGELVKDGSGLIIISNAANNYAGLTVINSGVINAQGTNALGSNAAGTIVNTGAALQVQTTAATTMTEPLALGGPGITIGTGSGVSGALENLGPTTAGNTITTGAITLLTDTTINVEVGQLDLAGVISGAGAINKGGAGTLQLAGANTYFGLTNVNGGILEANANTALGSIVSGTVIANGASLQVNGAAAETIVGESLQLTGTGYGLVTSGTELVNRGALASVANNNVWTGDITLNSTTSNVILDQVANSTLTILGQLYGSNPLTKIGAGNVILQASNTGFTGNLTVAQGILDLNAAGSVSSTNNIIVGVGATLAFDNSVNDAIGVDNQGVYLPNRISSTANLILNGGTLTVTGNNIVYATTAETLQRRQPGRRQLDDQYDHRHRRQRHQHSVAHYGLTNQWRHAERGGRRHNRPERCPGHHDERTADRQLELCHADQRRHQRHHSLDHDRFAGHRPAQFRHLRHEWPGSEHQLCHQPVGATSTSNVILTRQRA